MTMFEKKQKALILRRNGRSIKEIAHELKVAKSSVSLWCRNIKLSSEQTARLRAKMIQQSRVGSLKGANTNKEKKIRTISEEKEAAKRYIGTLSLRDVMLIAASLYWAEGSKTESRFVFINSDSVMIKLMYVFLTEVMKVEKERIRFTVQINAVHRPRINKVQKFWSELLGISLDHFGKPYYINAKPKKVYENYEVYYGIARLGVSKGSRLQYRMFGAAAVMGEGVVSQRTFGN